MRYKRKSRAQSLQPWRIEFFQRLKANDPARSVPAREFLDGCPPGVRGNFLAVVKAVAEAPPPQFAGGGKWEAMRGAMKGYYEVRITGPDRRQYRLFCLLERKAQGLTGPSLILITGMSKSFRTTFSTHDYGTVRRLGNEYKSHSPRPIAK